MRLIPRSSPQTCPTPEPRAYVSIDHSRCIACAAGASHAPELFEVSARGTRLKKQPETRAELELAETAALLCPVQAISVRPADPI